MLWCDMILDSGRGHVCCVAFVFSDPLRRLSLIRLKHSFAHTADEAANAVAQITAEKQSGGRESVSRRYRMERPRCQQRPRALRRHIQWRQSGSITRQSRRKSRPGQPGQTGDLQPPDTYPRNVSAIPTGTHRSMEKRHLGGHQ